MHVNLFDVVTITIATSINNHFKTAAKNNIIKLDSTKLQH